MPEGSDSGNSPVDIDDSRDCTGEGNVDREAHQNAVDPNNCTPLIAAGNLELFKQVATSFSDAERLLKFVDWIDGTDVPSINELRYVTYHLFKAFGADDEHQQREELMRAERHCKRACFDALELGVINQLELINQFLEDYKDFPLSDVVPGIVDKRKLLADAQLFLKNTTGGEYRDDYYPGCEDKLNTLIEINQTFQAARDEINKKRNQECERSKWSKLGVAATFIAPIVTLLLGYYIGKGDMDGVIADEMQVQQQEKDAGQAPKDEAKMDGQKADTGKK